MRSAGWAQRCGSRGVRPGPEWRSPMSDAKPVVFVVDDDVSVRGSLKLLIESAGWQPETFESGREFLSRPRVPAPSCLVLDVFLPDLNGLDLQNLVADRTDMPVIFITGHRDGPTTGRTMQRVARHCAP